MASSTRIYVGFVIFVAILGSAFLLPQVAAGNETGLAGGATAAVTFLALLLVALIVAVVVLVMTIRQRHGLPAAAKITGFLPLPLLFAAALVMVMFIRHKDEQRRQNEPPPRTLTPTTPVTDP